MSLETLPLELLGIISQEVVKDYESLACLRSLSRTSKHLCNLFQPILYENIELNPDDDTNHIRLLLRSLSENPKLALFTKSLVVSNLDFPDEEDEDYEDNWGNEEGLGTEMGGTLALLQREALNMPPSIFRKPATRSGAARRELSERLEHIGLECLLWNLPKLAKLTLQSNCLEPGMLLFDPKYWKNATKERQILPQLKSLVLEDVSDKWDHLRPGFSNGRAELCQLISLPSLYRFFMIGDKLHGMHAQRAKNATVKWLGISGSDVVDARGFEVLLASFPHLERLDLRVRGWNEEQGYLMGFPPLTFAEMARSLQHVSTTLTHLFVAFDDAYPEVNELPDLTRLIALKCISISGSVLLPDVQCEWSPSRSTLSHEQYHTGSLEAPEAGMAGTDRNRNIWDHLTQNLPTSVDTLMLEGCDKRIIPHLDKLAQADADYLPNLRSIHLNNYGRFDSAYKEKPPSHSGMCAQAEHDLLNTRQALGQRQINIKLRLVPEAMYQIIVQAVQFSKARAERAEIRKADLEDDDVEIYNEYADTLLLENVNRLI